MVNFLKRKENEKVLFTSLFEVSLVEKAAT